MAIACPPPTHDGVLEALGLVLLLEILDLLYGEEGPAASAHRLLRVVLAPLLERLRVPALHVQPQVLPVFGHEVAQFTREGLLSCWG